LDDILGRIKFPQNEHVLVDSGHADDAGIYKINDQMALVQTTDFFTPIVDDPYLFGQIAAANALSDIYAMGANPISALNIACFPDNVLDAQILSEILQGGIDKVAEDGVAVIGGHTIRDNELKYGLAVTGVIDPKLIKQNYTIKNGDVLLLTKPLGTGILTTALKNDHFTESDISDAIRSMLLLNREPAKILHKFGVNAVTDITGFGLLGHLSEMMADSGLGVNLRVSNIPFFDEAVPLAEKALHIPGGTLANINYIQDIMDTGKFAPWYMNLLADPQTSGGLLISMPAKGATRFIEELAEYPFKICNIGEIHSENKKITLI
jgi:selenide, water dikinase